MKLLVLRFSSIGDIVLTSPVLRCLKKQVPEVEIHFLTKKKFFGIVEHNPNIDRIFTFEKDLSPLIPELKKEKYDAIIDLHHNLRSAWLKTRLGIKSSSFDKLNLKKWAYVNLKWKTLPDVHIVDRYMETVNFLGVKNDGEGLEFYPCDCDKPEPNDLPINFQNQPFAVASIGGTHFTKKMPAEKWAELISNLKVPVVLIGGKEDHDAGIRIEKALSTNAPEIWNACGKFTIGGSAHILKQATLVLSHDTGMMHIAAAFQKPIVAIWGNTTPELGMYPYKTPFFNLEVKNLTCRPCSKIGYSTCPKGHFKCMMNQNLSETGLWDFVHSSISKSMDHGRNP